MYAHYVEGDLGRARELIGNISDTAAVPRGPGVRSGAVFPANQRSGEEAV
jgi:hypothetical protein